MSGDHSSMPQFRKERYVTPLDVQERTLKVTNYGRSVTESILRELFSQGGPIKKVVFKDVFSYIEFEDAESVGYCLALFDGVELFGDRLVLAPKIGHQSEYQYYNILKQYEQQFAMNPMQWWNKFGDPNKPCPTHICAYSAFRPPATNYEFYNPMQNHQMIAANQMPGNHMRNSPRMTGGQMPPQMAYHHPMNNQRPIGGHLPQMMPVHQMPSTSSNYHQLNQTRSEFDLRAERRPRQFETDGDFTKHLQSLKDRAWTRADRNNNERKLAKITYKYDSEQHRNQQGKRPFPESPPANHKRIRKYQSF